MNKDQGLYWTIGYLESMLSREELSSDWRQDVENMLTTLYKAAQEPAQEPQEKKLLCEQVSNKKIQQTYPEFWVSNLT